MNALELKNLLSNYPDSVLENLELTYREVGTLKTGSLFKKDIPIFGHRVDDETDEFCFLDESNYNLNHELFPIQKMYVEALERLTNKKVLLKEHNS